jgi:hypothetical protein
VPRHRQPNEPRYKISAENVNESPLLRDTMETAVIAAHVLWHKHRGERRVYITEARGGAMVRNFPPGEVERHDIACHDPEFSTTIHRIERRRS